MKQENEDFYKKLSDVVFDEKSKSGKTWKEIADKINGVSNVTLEGLSNYKTYPNIRILIPILDHFGYTLKITKVNGHFDRR